MVTKETKSVQTLLEHTKLQVRISQGNEKFDEELIVLIKFVMVIIQLKN